jgi:hypothetical protein
MESNDTLRFGLECSGHDPKKKWSAASQMSVFRSLYGMQPEAINDVFKDLQSNDVTLPNRILRPNLFMFFVTLYWLRSYDITNNILRIFGIGSHTTIRKHIRMYTKALQDLCHSKVKYYK